MIHTTEVQRTRIVPLRWVGNFLGNIAGDHLLHLCFYDENEDFSWRYKYHLGMWKFFNKPYFWWGTFYNWDVRKDID
jgi:glycerol uptake facilitator-like aquaporin